MQPLEFEPILKRIRWGSRRLGSVLGKPIGDETDYAESWEIADHGEDQSRVCDGHPWAGRTLNDLVESENEALFGRHAGRKQFPLLIKYLDACDHLSVQVHPDDQLARQFDPAENGKTEAWVIIDAEPGSRLYAGLKEGVDETTLRDALESGDCENCLHSFEVAPGDCLFIPAGTVHAIGAGILLAEVQQSSDLTFRLYDWGRVGADGKSREIHVEESIRCTDFTSGPVNPVVPETVKNDEVTTEQLVDCPFFVMHRHTTDQSFVLSHEDRFQVLMGLSGEAELDFGNGTIAMSAGKTALIPAAFQGKLLIRLEGETTILSAFLPDMI